MKDKDDVAKIATKNLAIAAATAAIIVTTILKSEEVDSTAINTLSTEDKDEHQEENIRAETDSVDPLDCAIEDSTSASDVVPAPTSTADAVDTTANDPTPIPPPTPTPTVKSTRIKPVAKNQRKKNNLETKAYYLDGNDVYSGPDSSDIIGKKDDKKLVLD